jgi:hypothetical protein
MFPRCLLWKDASLEELANLDQHNVPAVICHCADLIPVMISDSTSNFQSFSLFAFSSNFPPVLFGHCPYGDSLRLGRHNFPKSSIDFDRRKEK